LSRFLLLLHDLEPSQLGLFSPLLLSGDFTLLLSKKVLSTLLSRLFFEVSIMVLPFVFLQDEISALLRLIHFEVYIKLHIVHGQLDYVVGLIDLLYLLLGLIAKILYFTFSTLFSLLELVLEGTLPLK
jgi:hypothetical protein